MKMNIFKHLPLLALFAVAGLFVVSCSKDDDEPIEPEKKEIALDKQVEDIVFEVVSDTVFSSGHFVMVAANAATSFSDAQKQMAISLYKSQLQDYSDKIATEVGAKGSELMWRSVSFNYWSVDESGQDIKLSARAYWGYIDGKDLNPQNILLCPHYTITKNAECPTMTISYEALFLCRNNLLIMPDYIGFGATKDRVQPYVNHNLCAQNCIDALTAGYKVFAQSTKANLADNFKLCVVGASQGAGNALAVHKWIDTHPDFADAWHFAYSFCCAGPYSPAITFEKYFEQDKLTLPCAIPLTLKAMFAAYPDILGQWTEDDFYSDDYVTNLKPKIDEMIASKKFDTYAISNEFATRYNHDSSSVSLSDILSADALNRNSEMHKALFKCLDNNDLTKDWTPVHPIYLSHDSSDDVVPLANAEAMASAFPDKTNLTITKLGSGHLGSCLMWFIMNMSKTW